ncbi:MFS sugar transporter-like protein [Penicillium odoratum]|uniref:MFS sugar transporter-like protein n=1 Tax=Penicillium odoratum TaxID=1167516 RepID=UPI002548DA19|nr:MFS sugar transporter-like protein [Penicillium odoratum]KAJ5777042.1 MFS sugar transporter-like protein [Penicillium odoratum]
MPGIFRSSEFITLLLILFSYFKGPVQGLINRKTYGYDGSMMNGLNILPSYTEYFSLNSVTTALNTSAVGIGGAVAGFFNGLMCDCFGRRLTLFYASCITLVGIAIQSAAQNIGMFLAGRFIIGFGVGISSTASPTYLSETVPAKWRAFTLGLFYDIWYVGALIAAGVTYGTATIDSTWAWRIPSILQGLFTIICIVILPFVPESPRWLVFKGRNEESIKALAATHSNGDINDPMVLEQFDEIKATIQFEQNQGEKLTLLDTMRTPSNRKRMMLAMSVAVFSMISGNNIISYYLGDMLDNAGVTDTTTQLEINIILNCFCLVVSLVGSTFADRLGRRFLAISSTALLTIFIFILGALTKLYGTSTNMPGIYATVASIFLFQGSYSFGWTPLSVMYPPEVLHFSIRANGMGLYTTLSSAFGLLATFAFPIGLERIGWKIYMINGVWDVLELLFVIFFWVETKGKTLEEIDSLFDPTKHNDLATLEKNAGEVIIGQEVVEAQTELPKKERY